MVASLLVHLFCIGPFPTMAIAWSSTSENSGERHKITKATMARPKQDTFQCRPSLHVRPDINDRDNEIWVERSYVSATGRTIPYFTSIPSGRAQRYEPPSGANIIIYQSQTPMDCPGMAVFLNQRKSAQFLNAMPNPKPKLTPKQRHVGIGRLWRMIRRVTTEKQTME